MNLRSFLEKHRTALLALVPVLLVGTVIRCAFVLRTTLSEFDPWRHLQLLRNLQSGAGFTLFDGQPYIWYNEAWYLLAVWLGGAGGALWVSCALSILSIVLYFVFVLRAEHSLETANATGLLLAAFGPAVAFASTYGAESFALCLVISAWVLATFERSRLAVFAAGALFGLAVVSRLNFAFNLFLFLPFLRDRRRWLPIAGGLVIAPVVTWWSNHRVIEEHAWLFTWDGLATRTSDYGLLSTLVPQLHPAVAAATKTLYERTRPVPFDLLEGGHVVWGNAFFLVAGVLGIALSRRWTLALAGVVPLVFFTVFDHTLSSNFFRHDLAVFPAFFLGIVLAARRFAAHPGRGRPLVVPGVVAAVVVSGARYLRPRPVVPVEAVTPPASLVEHDRYMVNGGFYHPESLAYRFPDKRFIGLPLTPDEFDDFAGQFPEYSEILWHKQFSVQDALLHFLLDTGRYRVEKSVRNEAGAPYLLLTAQRP